MADNRHIIVFDFETSSANPQDAQILQIGAVIIDRNSLKIKDEFETLVKPDDVSTVQSEALKVNGLTLEQLETAPEAKVVFPTFASWIQKHNTKKDKSTFGAPIPAGWGIDGFDMPILNRYGMKYGYWDKKWNNQTLVNPIFTFDAMKHFWFWTRTNSELANIKLGTVLEYMGVPADVIAAGAHDALWDVKWSAKIIVKLLQVGQFLTENRPDVGTRRLEVKGCFAGQTI